MFFSFMPNARNENAILLMSVRNRVYDISRTVPRVMTMAAGVSAYCSAAVSTSCLSVGTGFTSASINNGSAFAGFSADTPYLNTVLGILILLGRLLPIVLVLALAGSFAAQDGSSAAVELPLHKPQFVGFLVFIIIFVALPTFVPILTLGPLAEGLG